MSSFETLGHLLKLPPFSAQKCHSAGGRGGPRIMFLIGILIFLLLRSPRKISEPYDNPFWDFSNSGKKKKKIKISASADGGPRSQVCAR